MIVVCAYLLSLLWMSANMVFFAILVGMLGPVIMALRLPVWEGLDHDATCTGQQRTVS